MIRLKMDKKIKPASLEAGFLLVKQGVYY